MTSKRETYLLRGLRGCCPRCGHKGVFKSHYRLLPACPACGLPLEHEDGWSLGAIPLNYAFTCLFWILPVGLIFLFGWISLEVALLVAGVGAMVIPFLTFHFTKALWIGVYYAVLPHEARSVSPKK